MLTACNTATVASATATVLTGRLHQLYTATGVDCNTATVASTTATGIDCNTATNCCINYCKLVLTGTLHASTIHCKTGVDCNTACNCYINYCNCMVLTRRLHQLYCKLHGVECSTASVASTIANWCMLTATLQLLRQLTTANWC